MEFLDIMRQYGIRELGVIQWGGRFRCVLLGVKTACNGGAGTITSGDLNLLVCPCNVVSSLALGGSYRCLVFQPLFFVFCAWRSSRPASASVRAVGEFLIRNFLFPVLDEELQQQHLFADLEWRQHGGKRQSRVVVFGDEERRERNS